MVIKTLNIDYIEGISLKLKMIADTETINHIKSQLYEIAKDYDNILGLIDNNDSCQKHFTRWNRMLKSWMQIMLAICPHEERGINQRGQKYCLKCKNITRRNVTY